MLYQAYGLSIRSEINLPELLPAADQNEGSATNVQIILDQVPKSGLKDARRLSEWLHISPNALWIDIDRVARFQITDGEVITVYPYPESDEDSIRLYLLGSAFGALLNQRGLFVLRQAGTLVSGTYELDGGWTGSLQGTLVNRKVFLVRIDSKLGRMMELEGFLSGEETLIRGTWLNYELAGAEGASGHWSARKRDSEP